MGLFKLQFRIGQVARYATRYSYEDDSLQRDIGVAAEKRGWYTEPHWLKHYNHTRPHSGIGNRPPSAAFTTYVGRPRHQRKQMRKAGRTLASSDSDEHSRVSSCEDSR
jgi:hypothetical protein